MVNLLKKRKQIPLFAPGIRSIGMTKGIPLFAPGIRSIGMTKEVYRSLLASAQSE